ncbi:unnamed protein product [Acanthoscelides obtectus]|uniref:Uncharacterized protein n=1 Tax=Acanthoscelides obtectus TaxID=200917 RepID=A0A9P0NSR0_ACAOB|nr:unnamed protein product [Acanthoscelides obtectus]CAH2009825.1 unnamed protein product [Acanthoscelides obtectus]CAK1641421.1 hypothetical protein AOBTE_LOCUS12390 [Acanthoscelides obtectus]CAK1663642.1 hypothetical protein AOBTE_LOCUS23765 [Acanthoscelides obtectus]
MLVEGKSSGVTKKCTSKSNMCNEGEHISIIPKTVSFNETKNKVHIMYAWQYAYREARRSNGEMADRCRFQRRVQLVEEVLKKYLTVDYRQTVFTERFKV